MTKLWQYVCESYCRVYLVPLDLMSSESMFTWPVQPDPLGYVVREWLRPAGFLEGSGADLPWFWTWRWPSARRMFVLFLIALTKDLGRAAWPTRR